MITPPIGLVLGWQVPRLHGPIWFTIHHTYVASATFAFFIENEVRVGIKI